MANNIICAHKVQLKSMFKWEERDVQPFKDVSPLLRCWRRPLPDRQIWSWRLQWGAWVSMTAGIRRPSSFFWSAPPSISACRDSSTISCRIFWQGRSVRKMVGSIKSPSVWGYFQSGAPKPTPLIKADFDVFVFSSVSGRERPTWMWSELEAEQVGPRNDPGPCDRSACSWAARYRPRWVWRGTK